MLCAAPRNDSNPTKNAMYILRSVRKAVSIRRNVFKDVVEQSIGHQLQKVDVAQWEAITVVRARDCLPASLQRPTNSLLNAKPVHTKMFPVYFPFRVKHKPLQCKMKHPAVLKHCPEQDWSG